MQACSTGHSFSSCCKCSFPPSLPVLTFVGLNIYCWCCAHSTIFGHVAHNAARCRYMYCLADAGSIVGLVSHGSVNVFAWLRLMA